MPHLKSHLPQAAVLLPKPTPFFFCAGFFRHYMTWSGHNLESTGSYNGFRQNEQGRRLSTCVVLFFNPIGFGKRPSEKSTSGGPHYCRRQGRARRQFPPLIFIYHCTLVTGGRRRSDDGAADGDVADDGAVASKKQPKQKKIKQKPKLQVKHDYEDYSQSSFSQFMESHPNHKCARELKGSLPFPRALHAVLKHVTTTGQEDIISWCSHGRAFAVHDDDVFVSDIMPLHFRQTKFSSFQRQLNLYGFRRLTKGRDKGAYYHELFLRGKVDLCRAMSRITVKGTNRKAANNPHDEPDFYKMPPLTAKYADAAPAAAATTSKTTSTRKARPTKPTAHKTMSILSSALAVSLPSKLSGSLKEPSTCNSGMEEMGPRTSMLTKRDSDASISTTLRAHTGANEEEEEEEVSAMRAALYSDIDDNDDTLNQIFKELEDDSLRPRPLAPPTQGEVDNRSYYKTSFPDSETRSTTMAEAEAPAVPDGIGDISVSDEECVEGEDFSEFVW